MSTTKMEACTTKTTSDFGPMEQNNAIDVLDSTTSNITPAPSNAPNYQSKSQWGKPQAKIAAAQR